jgi:hypothetical protein
MASSDQVETKSVARTAATNSRQGRHGMESRGGPPPFAWYQHLLLAGSYHLLSETETTYPFWINVAVLLRRYSKNNITSIQTKLSR